MNKKYDFDYIIIGSGPAGSTAALTLSKSKKKRIAIVEGGACGGSDLATYNIPYEVGLDFAHTFYNLANYPELGRQNLHFNFPTTISHQDQIVSTLQNKLLQDFKTAGITYINGAAHFLNSHTVAVNDQQYTAANFILATGAKPKTSEIAGLDSVKCLTPDTIIRVRRLPKFVFVVGGGSTGCEIAEYFAKLGSKVIIMEQSERILPKEDVEVSETISQYFTKELGIIVMPNARVVAIEQDNVSKKVIFSTNHQEKVVRIDCVLLATGSVPSVDYGLENAGVKYKPTGIAVNKSFQTSNKHIYAIGDCIGGESSTERSQYQATILTSNLLKKSKTLPNYRGFVRVTNTYPEIAKVGLNEVSLTKLKRKFKKSIVYLKDTPAGVIKQQDYGFVKILTDHNLHIIGATIVAPNASIVAAELSIAVRHRLSALEIASTPHITNSVNYAIKLAAKQLIK